MTPVEQAIMMRTNLKKVVLTDYISILILCRDVI